MGYTKLYSFTFPAQGIASVLNPNLKIKFIFFPESTVWFILFNILFAVFTEHYSSCNNPLQPLAFTALSVQAWIFSLAFKYLPCAIRLALNSSLGYFRAHQHFKIADVVIQHRWQESCCFGFPKIRISKTRKVWLPRRLWLCYVRFLKKKCHTDKKSYGSRMLFWLN